ncbi:MAG: GNAT family N-acetyltransferase [Akkermansiaceae bacterium]|nr:GNAT family N-acetyltransferase [Armatimonadota bacterium]
MIPIETERLLIRRMSEQDVEEFLEYQSHPEVMRYQPYEAATPERAAYFLRIQSTSEPSDEGAYLAFAVHHKEENRMIGEVSINVLPKSQSKGEIGWSFHTDFHGKGYATEAARALLAYGFSFLGLHRITTFCDVRNAPSIRLMERIGMRREGHALKSMLLRGTWQDTYLYALLREEWLQGSESENKDETFK